MFLQLGAFATNEDETRLRFLVCSFVVRRAWKTTKLLDPKEVQFDCDPPKQQQQQEEEE